MNQNISKPAASFHSTSEYFIFIYKGILFTTSPITSKFLMTASTTISFLQNSSKEMLFVYLSIFSMQIKISSIKNIHSLYLDILNLTKNHFPQSRFKSIFYNKIYFPLQKFFKIAFQFNIIKKIFMTFFKFHKNIYITN